MAVPTYLLIAADLRSKIAAGEMRPGTQLPPEKDLQDEYQNLSGVVSRNTVRAAIEMLVREGLLERRRGQGTFIVGPLDSLPGYTPPTWPDPSSSMQMHLDFDVDDPDATEARVLAAGATRYDYQSNDHCRVYADPAGHPFCLSTEDVPDQARPCQDQNRGPIESINCTR